MKSSLVPDRLASAFVVVALSLICPVSLARAESFSGAGEVLVWLVGVNKAREQGTPQKLDINSASVEQLAALPGLDRRQALRVTSVRPYARLQDLTRAGLSPRLIERLAGLLMVGHDTPSASPRSAERRASDLLDLSEGRR
jgi:DNA uptake protein ComE-like DNA-binding protein